MLNLFKKKPELWSVRFTDRIVGNVYGYYPEIYIYCPGLKEENAEWQLIRIQTYLDRPSFVWKCPQDTLLHEVLADKHYTILCGNTAEHAGELLNKYLPQLKEKWHR